MASKQDSLKAADPAAAAGASLSELFRKTFGSAPSEPAPLRADGSARRLFRLAGAGRRVVGVFGPDRLENEAFLSFSRHFRKAGMPVPEIYAEDLQRGVYIEEDLGDTTLFEHLTAERAAGGGDFPASALAAYRKTIDWLPRFQFEAGRGLDYSRCYPRPAFDRQSVMWDLNYFKYYFLRLAKIPFNEAKLEDDFNRFADFLLKAGDSGFLYRDFQSRNVMLRGGEPWFIDYQGGRRGPAQYDIASLLYDAKADIPPETRLELLDYYLEAAGRVRPTDRAEFLRYFHGFVFVRIMQAMGAYGLRGFYERKTHFLQSVPYAVRNLEWLLRRADLPEKLPELTGVFKRITASSLLRQFGAPRLGLTVRIESFSFKNGVPTEERGHGGGFVFDCRALPNPGREERFAQLTGRDKPVADYLSAEPAVKAFLDSVFSLVEASVDNYQKRNFTDLSVAFGCTGGRHRSVYCAEAMARRLKGRGKLAVELRHREIGAAGGKK